MFKDKGKERSFASCKLDDDWILSDARRVRSRNISHGTNSERQVNHHVIVAGKTSLGIKEIAKEPTAFPLFTVCCSIFLRLSREITLTDGRRGCKSTSTLGFDGDTPGSSLSSGCQVAIFIGYTRCYSRMDSTCTYGTLPHNSAKFLNFGFRCQNQTSPVAFDKSKPRPIP